jgi:hypothetical protein
MTQPIPEQTGLAAWIDARIDNAENNIITQLTTPERLTTVAEALTPILVPAIVDALADKIAQAFTGGAGNIITSVNTHTDAAAHAITADIGSITAAIAAAPGQIIQGVISGIKGAVPFLEKKQENQ